MKTRVLFPLVFIVSLTLLFQLRKDRLFIVLHAATSTVAPSSTQHHHGHDKDETIQWFEEPYVNRWQRKFYDNLNKRRRGGGGNYLFFKHIRKAGGTTLRNYLQQVLIHHDNPRTAADFVRSLPARRRNDVFLLELQRLPSVHEYDLKLMNETMRTLRHSNHTATAERRHSTTIHYAEQEFSAMDWQCPRLDPRWDTTLSVVLLRHPVERHLSEFFYSGPGSKLALNPKKLDGNTTYRRRLKTMLQKELPRWLDDTQGDKRTMNWYFGRYYTDNFQLRALAGCSSGSCLHSKNLTVQEDALIQRGIRTSINVTSSSIRGACTMYFNEKIRIMDPCRFHDQSVQLKTLCPDDCDTPCRYPAAAWGTVDRTDLARAVSALDGFDAVFLTETLDDDDQAAFLADVMGVPRNATFSLTQKNTKTRKRSEREKTHFYRDLLRNLTLEELSLRIHEENELEIALYEHAVELNRKMVDRWKNESGWNG